VIIYLSNHRSYNPLQNLFKLNLNFLSTLLLKFISLRERRLENITSVIYFL